MKSSRRRFLCSTLAAPLAAGLDPRGWLRPEGAARPSGLFQAGEEQFPNPHFIRYDKQCFTVNDRDTFLFSASFHYPRCPQALWRDRLEKLKRAGFNTIETYVFWNYHEPEEGRVDLSEFESFVRLVGEMKLWMIARPGPYVCAEWHAGGFPDWIIARRFPLRSNDPESVRTSQHWYNEVLPVIGKYQVTRSGPIILMQIENEYDYWKLDGAAKRDYLEALANLAWNAGIDVPLITCWTKQVRERSDDTLKRIMDTCNFYPRWNVVKEVVPGLAKLRREEPGSPVGVAELQGGWFSEIGGKLSVDQDGVNGAQLSLISKTAVEQGAAFFNYYMGFGGTNFDWAAQNLTTTYDYAAPLREPGGVWEKYDAARGVGAGLALLGPLLTRATALEGIVQATNANVSASERVNGKSGVLFVRENGHDEQRYKLRFADPHSPTHRMISAPREGELVLGPREMKMLPVQIPIEGGRLCYSTAEVLVSAVCDRPYLVIYDDPGRLVELGLATQSEPQVEGDTVYRYWDPEYESVVIGVRVGVGIKVLFFNNTLQLFVVPRHLALRSWTAPLAASVVPGAQGSEPYSMLFLSDATGVGESGTRKNRTWTDLDFQPGEHDVAILMPPRPSKCFVNGVETDFAYDRHPELVRVHLATSPLPQPAVTLSEVETWVEAFDSSAGSWLTTPLRALQELGPLPYGYVKYRAQFSAGANGKMAIASFSDDAKKVFLNGKLVAEASKPARELQFDLAGYAQPGENTLEISYEMFGSANFGEHLADLKGLSSVSHGAGSQSTRIDPWQLQRFPPPMRGRELDPRFRPKNSKRASIGGGGAGPPEPAFAWCRAEFNLDAAPEGWFLPLKVSIDADRDALLYLNGKFVGRYAIVGPQTEFYLPEPYRVFGGPKNVLTVVLAYTSSAQALHRLIVAPYAEFATSSTRIEFEW